MTKPKKSLFHITTRSLVTTRRFLSLSAVLVLVSVIVVFTVIIPQVQATLEIQSKLEQEEKRLSNLVLKEQSLQTVSSQEAFQQRENVDAILPSHKPLLELMVGLNSAANRTQVTFTNFSLSPGQIATAGAKLDQPKTSGAAKKSSASGPTAKMQIELKAEGSFLAMKNFLAAAEKTAPLMTITNISLNPVGKRGVRISDSDLVTAELTLNVSYFTQSISATLEAPLPALGTVERQAMDELAGFTVPRFEERQAIMGGGLLNLFGNTDIGDEIQEYIRQNGDELTQPE